MTASYLALVQIRPARRLIYALAAGALSFGMVALTVLLTVERATGSYQDGGFAVAAFAVTAGATAPFRGRVVDRRGVRIWLPGMALAYAAALAVLDVAAHAGTSAGLLIGLAGIAGVSAPPLFASARAMWPLVVEPALLRRGYALTSLVGDVGQVAGPALASLLFLASGWIGALACGATALAGAALALPGRGPARPARTPAPMPRLFAGRGLPGLLVVSIALGVALGLVQVSVPVLAGRWHRPALAGPLLAAFGLGSVLGALWYGTRPWRAPVIDRYLRSVLALGVLLAPLALAGSARSLAPLLLLAGLAFGPATVSLFEALDVLAPRAGAEALAWVTTAEAGGTAAGSALAGILATHAGAAAALGLAGAVVAVPAGVAVAVRGAGR